MQNAFNFRYTIYSSSDFSVTLFSSSFAVVLGSLLYTSHVSSVSKYCYSLMKRVDIKEALCWDGKYVRGCTVTTETTMQVFEIQINNKLDAVQIVEVSDRQSEAHE
jgi:hypothetical protein